MADDLLAMILRDVLETMDPSSGAWEIVARWRGDVLRRMMLDHTLLSDPCSVMDLKLS